MSHTVMDVHNCNVIYKPVSVFLDITIILIYQKMTGPELDNLYKCRTISGITMYRIVWSKFIICRSVLPQICNGNCSCDPTAFTPVCGSDGLNYFSPCYAGCQLESRTDNRTVTYLLTYLLTSSLFHFRRKTIWTY